MNFDYNFTAVCSKGSNQQYASIGSDNSLATTWRQAIIWTNDGLVCWRIYASPRINELSVKSKNLRQGYICYNTILLRYDPYVSKHHHSDVIMCTMAFQITGVSIVYLTVCSGADQGKHQSSASLASARGIHRWPVNSPHKRPITREMFPSDDVIMTKAKTCIKKPPSS